MSPTAFTISSQVSNPALEFVRYFPRQLLTADDMLVANNYFREKLRRHNRMLHGWGVVCGCEVTLKPGTVNWVTVAPGYLINPNGDEIEIPQAVDFNLEGDWRQPYAPCANLSPCSPGCPPSIGSDKPVYLAACYTECNTRPVRIHPAGCGCDEAACEYSRVRESFEIVRLDDLPEAYTKQAVCLDRPTGCCVILATITSKDGKLTIDNNQDRKKLAGAASMSTPSIAPAHDLASGLASTPGSAVV